MTIFEKPYFLNNKDWYEVNDGAGNGYVLTDKAPQKAIDSYNEFYKDLEQEKLRKLWGLDAPKTNKNKKK